MGLVLLWSGSGWEWPACWASSSSPASPPSSAAAAPAAGKQPHDLKMPENMDYGTVHGLRVT